MMISEEEDGTQTLIPTCFECYEEAFCPDGWMKLHGDHPKTQARCTDSDNPCFDGEHVYHEIDLKGRKYPHIRGPILRLRRSSKDIVESSNECSLCCILLRLDTRGHLREGKHDAVIDLQLFYPENNNGARFRRLLSVKLKLEARREAYRKKIFTYRTFLALLLKDEPEEGEFGEPAPLDKSESSGTAVPGEIDRLPNTEEEPEAPAILDKRLNEAHRWLRHCEANHEECRLSQKPFLPMRILQLHAHGSSFAVKLVDTSECRRQGRYVALSYVWGTTPTKHLVRGNYESFMSGIAYQELPKTMQDAVQATCALGISYLWIDALCIVQDDAADKELQIPHMNLYYRNAAVVISSSGASNAYMGFLSNQPSVRDIYARVSDQIIAVHPSFGPLPFYIPFTMEEMPTVVRLEIDPPLYSYYTEPINKRGWTLQESRLARRLLIFPATGGILLRCRKEARQLGQVQGHPFEEIEGSYNAESDLVEIDDSEEDDQDDGVDERSKIGDADIDKRESIGGRSGGNDHEDRRSGYGETQANNVTRAVESTNVENGPIDETVSSLGGQVEVEKEKRKGVSRSKNLERNLRQFLIADVKEESEEGKVLDEWITTVQDYSRRSLSQRGDILIAIGALAQEFHVRHGSLLGDYAAGLWMKTFLPCLLWHTPIKHRRDQEAVTTPTCGTTPPYVAPSWSWATCGESVTFRCFVETDLDFMTRNTPKTDKPYYYAEVLDCQTSLTSEFNRFGAVLGGYVIIKGTLISIIRKPNDRVYPPAGRDAIALLRGVTSPSDFFDFFTADSAAAFALIDSRCYWLPVFYATRGRSRGIIVRERLDGNFQRLGFAEICGSKDLLEQGEERTLRLV